MAQRHRASRASWEAARGVTLPPRAQPHCAGRQQVPGLRVALCGPHFSSYETATQNKVLNQGHTVPSRTLGNKPSGLTEAGF